MDAARDILRAEYPFTPTTRTARRYTKRQMIQVFVRDGFVDRFSGARLVFPGALRLVSKLLPDEFPFHPNGKLSEGHIGFWELFPTVDHVVPVARGGSDTEENWVTTSMLTNAAKGLYLPEELGWTMQPAGTLSDWDGLLSWFIGFVDAHPEFLKEPYIRNWRRVAPSNPLIEAERDS
jgi:hypothetical protein